MSSCATRRWSGSDETSRDGRCASAVAAIALYGWLNGSLSGGVLHLHDRLALSATVVALHLSAFAAGLMLGGALGHLAHRLPSRLVCAALAAGLLPFIVAPHAVVSLTTAAALGVAGSITLAGAQASVARSRPADTARVLLLANTAAAATAATAAAAIAALPEGREWLAVLPAFGLASLAGFPPGRRPTPAPRGRSPARSVVPGQVAGLVLVGCVVGVEHTLANQLGPFLADTGSGTVAAAAPSVLFAGLLTGRALGVVLSHLPPTTVLTASLAVVVLGLLPIWLTSGAETRLAATAIVGLGLGCLYPLAVTVVLTTSRDVSRSSGHITVAIGASLLLAPLTTGAVTDVGTPRHGFGVLVALTVLAPAMLWALNAARRRGT